MSELKPFEVIMRIDFAASDKKQICAHAEKVQELVRCKDCIHAKEMTQYGCSECVRHCEKLKIVTSPDWFCAEGRRKDEGGPD